MKNDDIQNNDTLNNNLQDNDAQVSYHENEEEYSSHINPKQQITGTHWVVSLVAKAKGKNPEHAFLIVEGLSKDRKKIHFRRYDFVIGNQARGPALFGRNPGLVVMKEIVLDRADYDKAALAFSFWANLMSDEYIAHECHGATWSIGVHEASKLHQSVETDKANPPGYHILGKESLFQKISCSQDGHNCFSWAKRKVRDLNENFKNDARLFQKAGDLVASKTTNHLKPPRSPESPSPEPSSPGLSSTCSVM